MLRKDEKRQARPSGVSTANPEEIARFQRLAEEWWKPDGAFTVVHAFNRARVEHLSRRLPILMGRNPDGPALLAGLSLLDAGCGAGLVSEPMAALGAEVIGIDASERSLLIAR